MPERIIAARTNGTSNVTVTNTGTKTLHVDPALCDKVNPTTLIVDLISGASGVLSNPDGAQGSEHSYTFSSEGATVGVVVMDPGSDTVTISGGMSRTGAEFAITVLLV